MSLQLSSLLALALAYAGMTGLCLAMDRHYKQATGHHEAPPQQRLTLRLMGSAGLAASLHVCLTGWGQGVGWVVWLGFLTAGALLVIGLCAWRPRLAVGTAALCAATSLLAFASASASHT